jgi:hypothetical protein
MCVLCVCVNSTEGGNRQCELSRLTKYQVLCIDIRVRRTGPHLSNFRTKGTSDGSKGDIKPGVDERYGHRPPPPLRVSLPSHFFFCFRSGDGGDILGSLNKTPPFLLISENGLPVLARHVGRQMRLPCRSRSQY